MKKCDHYWSYPHSIWQGRKPDEAAIGRYCHKCGKQEMAFTSKWTRVLASYPDMKEAMERDRVSTEK